MLIKKPPRWQIGENKATPESVFLNRRRFLTGGAMAIGAAGVLAGSSHFFGGSMTASSAQAADNPSADLYPAPHNDKYKLDRPVTSEADNLSYNNFYEFGSSKTDPEFQAQALKINPWEVRIDGLVEKDITIDFYDLVRKMPLEERLYRHRCVEAWAMAIPWSGFPLKALVDFAKPLSGAKYLRMETFEDPEVARGQRASWYPWPYVEGVTIEEAQNEMAFIATGAYGKPIAKQMGAPLRLALPWKYGFKSIKSIVRFTFTDERPETFWEASGPSEYGFWANVNPDVPHRRWSQARERYLGSNEYYETQLYNGYAEEVAYLYKDLKDEPLFM